MLRLGDSVDKLMHSVSNISESNEIKTGIKSIFIEYRSMDWQVRFVGNNIKYYITYDKELVFMNLFDKNGRSVEVYTEFDNEEMYIFIDEPIACVGQFATRENIQSTDNYKYLHSIKIEFPHQTDKKNVKYAQINKILRFPTNNDNIMFCYVSKVRMELNYKCRNNRLEAYKSYNEMLTDINGLRPPLANGFIEIEYVYDYYNFDGGGNRYEKVIKYINLATITPTEMSLNLVGGDNYNENREFNNLKLLNLKINNGKEYDWTFENDFLNNNSIYVNDEVKEI